MEIISQLSAVVVPIFICAGVGLAWARLGWPFDPEVVTSLVYNIGAPCLIITTFARVELSPAALAELAGAGIIAYAMFAAVGLIVLRTVRLAVPSYLPALMFPLTGSMGLPVCFFAFGEPGLALALVYFTIGTVGTFTIGATIAAGRVSLAALLRTPAVYAVILAVALEIAGMELPRWVLNTTGLLAGIVIPTQLIALGLSLASLRVASLRRSLALALVRLGMGVAIGYGVAEALGLTGVAWAVVILQSSMPVAVSSYLFARLYRREPEEVAGMVVLSTAISFATLPLLLLVVL